MNYLDKECTFAFETTLDTKSYKSKIIEAKAKGYKVKLLFFWLQNVNLACERVRTRVLEGGHNIPTETIKRRYTRGIKNLFEIYLPIVDEVLIFDNSNGNHKLIAEKSFNSKLIITDETDFQILKNKIYEKK